MKIIKGINRLYIPYGGTVVTVGVFDGLHVGHMKVISDTVKTARRLGLKSAVVTFDPHPAKIVDPSQKVPSIISLAHRIRLISQLGADYLVIINFTPSMAKMSAGRFLKKVLSERLKAKVICVGENFYFGKGGSAGIGELRRIASAAGIKAVIVKPAKSGRRMISSSIIRRLIKRGELSSASKLLGRPVSILGTVVSGARLARSLGYPTANLNPHHEVVPPSGVYAVWIKYGQRYMKGVLNIGNRPTFYGPRDREEAIEVHIFNFSKNIYGKDIEVFFVKKLRDEARFKDDKALVKQIKMDMARAKSILK